MPYAALVDALGLAAGRPSLDALNALAAARETTQAHGLPVRFVAPARRLSARDYERHVLTHGEVPTRVDTWHDILNALVWMRFPRFKAALNAAHGEAMADEPATRRGRIRDAMTVLDESGVWIASAERALRELLVDRTWKGLFHTQRRAVETSMDFVVVGHALLEKALDPYPSMTGKCLLLDCAPFDVDAVETAAVRALAAVGTPRDLPPLPVQGVPGWDAANVYAAYYDNTEIFRPRDPDGGRLTN